MSHPPNNPTISARSPQHGIHIASCAITPSSSKAVRHGTPTEAIRVLTVNCASTGCANKVTVVPFGYHHDGAVNIKVNCRECYVPVVMAEKKVEKVVGEEEWAQEGDEEEW